MKIRASLFTIGIIVIISSCSTNQAGNGKLGEHEIPEFTIEFPESKYEVEKTETINRNLGGILITNWILQGAENDNPYMYFVAHNIMPKKLQGLVSSDPLLDIALKGMLTGSADKLGGFDYKFTEINLDGHHGMESICKVFDGQGIIKSRVYIIDNDIFMISAGGKQIDIESVDTFLNSFEI